MPAPEVRIGPQLTNGGASGAGAIPGDGRGPSRGGDRDRAVTDFLGLQAIGLFLRCYGGLRGIVRRLRIVEERLRH